MTNRLLLGLLLAMAVGCNAPRSDSGRLRLDPHGMTIALSLETSTGWDGSQPVVEGATLCPRYACARDCTAPEDELFADVSGCFTTVATGGPLELDDDGCFRVTGAGELELSLTPGDCEVPVDVPLEADAFHLSSVSLASVRARPYLGVEHILQAYVRADLALPVVDFPSDIFDAEARYFALAGAPVRIPLELLRLDDAPVAVDASGLTTLDPAPPSVIEEGRHPLVTLAAGETYALSAALHGQDLDAGQVVGVDASDIVSIELIPFVVGTDDEDHRSARLTGPGAPSLDVHSELLNLLAVRAVVRDGAGNIVLGVPVEWDLTEGAAVVHTLQGITDRHASRSLDEYTPSDLVTFSDLCRPPEALEGDLRWTVVARFGEVSGAVTVELDIGPLDAAPDARDEWRPNESCLGPDVAEIRPGEPAGLDEPPLQINPAPGCGCEQSEPRGPAFGIAALLGLALVRRRRR